MDAPVDVSGAGADAFAPQVAAATDGEIVWQRDGAAGQEVQAATVSETGALGAVQALSAGGTNEEPAVAVDDEGNAVVVWRRSNGGDVVIQANTLVITWLRFADQHIRVQAVPLSAAGVPGAVQTHSAAGSDANNAAIAIDADGDSVIVWDRSGDSRIHAQTMTEAGDLGMRADLSEVGGSASQAQVGVDSTGDALADHTRATRRSAPAARLAAPG